MTLLAVLIPCPLLICILALAGRRRGVLPRLAAVAMGIHALIVAYFWLPRLHDSAIRVQELPVHGLNADTTGTFFVLVITLVALASFTHATGFFARESQVKRPPADRHISQFYFFAALFVLAMYVVVLADNLGYMWIGMEATTLLSAPLVYFHRSRHSLEATWKYLIICSVGIAFGFFGTALIYTASQHSGVLGDGSLSVLALTAHAHQLPAGLVRMSYVFLLLGYGTKAGLFPLHNWLPDAHSEAPAPASALLSGSLLNCALVAIWRVSGLAQAAGQGALVRVTLLPMAVITVVFASLCLIKQRDIKRLLAYSSMENVGIMAAAISLGSWPGFALQALNHSVCKTAVFLLAGNLLQRFKTKDIGEIKGLLNIQPGHTMLLLLGLAAVAGTPPFGSFLAEWQILSSAADQHRLWLVLILAAALAVAFIALALQAGSIAFGKHDASGKSIETADASASLILVPGVLMIVSLCLGIAFPMKALALIEGVLR